MKNSYWRTLHLISLVLLTALLFLLIILLFLLLQISYGEQEAVQHGRAAVLTRKLPHSIIIGARKCGTRALLDFLNLHPDVLTASEEIHFFDKRTNYQRGLSWYRSRMPLSEVNGHHITLEKSPAYFVTGGVPHRMRAMNSSLRLVLIVRDPVLRVISDYAQIVHNKLSRGKIVPTLEKLVFHRNGRVNPSAKMVRTSTYATHLHRWQQRFPASQIHVVDGDRLVIHPLNEMKKLENFLGLREVLNERNFVFNFTKGFYCARSTHTTDRSVHCLGKEKGRRHPPVAHNSVRKLRRFFRRHDSKFARLTNRTFLWMEGGSKH